MNFVSASCHYTRTNMILQRLPYTAYAQFQRSACTWMCLKKLHTWVWSSTRTAHDCRFGCFFFFFPKKQYALTRHHTIIHWYYTFAFDIWFFHKWATAVWHARCVDRISSTGVYTFQIEELIHLEVYLCVKIQNLPICPNNCQKRLEVHHLGIHYEKIIKKST